MTGLNGADPCRSARSAGHTLKRSWQRSLAIPADTELQSSTRPESLSNVSIVRADTLLVPPILKYRHDPKVRQYKRANCVPHTVWLRRRWARRKRRYRNALGPLAGHQKRALKKSEPPHAAAPISPGGSVISARTACSSSDSIAELESPPGLRSGDRREVA